MSQLSLITSKEFSSINLQSMMELCTLPTMLTDLFGKVIAYNKDAADVLHYSNEKMSGLKTHSIFPIGTLKHAELPLTVDQIASHVFEPVEVIMGENKNLMLFFRAKEVVLDGKIYYSCSFKPPFIEYNLDLKMTPITSIKSLYKDYEKLMKLTDMANETLTLLDKKGIVTFVSGSCLSVLGYAPEEIINKPVVEFFSATDKEAWSQMMDEILQGKTTGIVQCKSVHKGGQILPLEGSYRVLQNEQTKEVSSILFTIRDISSRIEQMRLEQAKMDLERTRTATAILTHDIRNLLMAIDVSIDKLMEDVVTFEDRRLYSSAIRASSASIATICNSYLTFYMVMQGKLKLEPQPLLVTEITNALLAIFNPIAVASKIHFGIEYIGVVPDLILADQNCLKETLFNLVTNAMKFTPEGGKIRLSITGKDLPENNIRLHFALRDNGPGISDDRRNTLLQDLNNPEPPKLTKPSGLGLWFSQKFVRAMGGEGVAIDCPTHKKGTIFSFELVFQKAKKVDEIASIALLKEQLAKYNAHVLSVDDNQLNTVVLNKTLQALGVSKLQTARSAMQAIALVAQQQFDIIMMDWQMPQIDGVEAVKRIVEQNKNLPAGFVMCSGSQPSAEAAQQLAGIRNVRWILKPYKPVDVYNNLRDFLVLRDYLASTPKEEDHSLPTLAPQ